jgi:hypothetical protein
MYLDIKISDRDGIIKEHNINIQIPLLNQKGKVNIGKIVHRLMKSINFNDQPRIYKLAIVNISIIEKNATTQIGAYTINNIMYLAGKTNNNISVSKSIGILDIYEGTSRVFKSTVYFINLFSKNKIYAIKIFRNNILFDSYTYTLQNQLFTETLGFSFFNAGDVIDYFIEKEIIVNNTVIGIESIKKRFIVFPEPLQKMILSYENDYKVMGMIECTGDVSIGSEYKYFTNVKYENIVETLENVTNERQTKLIINTGFLLKEEHQVIDAILRSPRCRLSTFISNIDTGIDLVPVSKDIAEMSTDQSLYSFRLEFIINRTHHEKVYSI